jgi:hypothetical protein
MKPGTPERCEGKGGIFSWKGTFELIYKLAILAIGGGSKKVQYLVFITPRPPPPLPLLMTGPLGVNITIDKKRC